MLRGTMTRREKGVTLAAVRENSGQRNDLVAGGVVHVDLDGAAFEEFLDLLAPADGEKPRLEIAVPPATEFLEVVAVRARARTGQKKFCGHNGMEGENKRPPTEAGGLAYLWKSSGGLSAYNASFSQSMMRTASSKSSLRGSNICSSWPMV